MLLGHQDVVARPVDGRPVEDLRTALHRTAVPAFRASTLAGALSVALLMLAAGVAAALWLLLAPAADPEGGAQVTSRAVPGFVEPAPPPPPVEPVRYLDVTRDTARALNAAVPFSTLPNPPASPARLGLAGDEAARATDCLAAAVWYEAGDDATGERAVAQVVLNRLRHRAFPKSVCGVVFQGSERTTGCQFSFTCDGSMLRRQPGPAAWERARAVASVAIGGGVFAPVGWATHYHTDWVVPNWSGSVDKIAQVGTHLFFRWKGANGRAVAFRSTATGTEPAVPAMARLSPVHAGQGAGADSAPGDGTALAAPPVLAAAAPPAPDADLRGNTLQGGDGASGVYVLQIKPDQFSGTLALVAVSMCRGRADACTVVGFQGAPGRVVSGGLGRLSFPDGKPDFYYFADPARGRETVLWNCRAFPRPVPTQCIPDAFAPAG
jgi:hypothetical protein